MADAGRLAVAELGLDSLQHVRSFSLGRYHLLVCLTAAEPVVVVRMMTLIYTGCARRDPK